MLNIREYVNEELNKYQGVYLPNLHLISGKAYLEPSHLIHLSSVFVPSYTGLNSVISVQERLIGQ